ncbi:MAG: RNA-directed DNA polymerase [Candidatus Moraniibacteriota bacterium]|nr:MAG: RNA-directed DNA polymerase [Candidatus Moranbacteria bacterium]
MNKQELFEKILSAYYDARKNKRKSHDAIFFEMNYEKECMRLCEELMDRTYRISPSSCFIVNRPVKREIFAGAFRDRVIHHFLFNAVNPWCETMFIRDTYSCRKGKGTSYAVSRAIHFLRSVSKNYSSDAWVIRLDIAGYFMSIRKDILFSIFVDLLERHRNAMLYDFDLLFWLGQKIIDNNPIFSAKVKGKKEDWVGLPRNKSLYWAEKGCGLPIGNLTSQLFANVYLSDFDYYVRSIVSRLGGCYGRYVDDILIFIPKNKNIRTVVQLLEQHLFKKRRLYIHPKKIFTQPYKNGFSFVGRYILPYRIYIKRKTKQNMKKILLRR